MTAHRIPFPDRRWAGPVALAVLLIVSEWLYLRLVLLEAVSAWESVGKFLAAMAMLFIFGMGGYLLWHRDPESRTLRRIMIVGAILFRLTLLPAGLSQRSSVMDIVAGIQQDVTGTAVSYDSFLLFDCDIWRYLWDSHLSHRVGTPYGLVPASGEANRLATDGFWEEIRYRVQFPEIATVYPPGAELLFLLSYWLAPGSIAVFKLILIALDLGVVLLLERVLLAYQASPELLILYAWNPLVIKVFAGSAHYDVLLVLILTGMLFALAKGWRLATGCLLGLAVSVKIAPLVLAPLLFRRVGVRGLVVGAACILATALPFWVVGQGDISGMLKFSGTWEFNAGIYGLLRASFESLGMERAATMARIVSVGGLATLVAVVLFRDRGSIRSFPAYAALTLGGLILLSPVVNPWYVTWVLPLALAGKRSEWAAITVFVCFAFFVMADGRERWWVLLLEHAGFLALIVSSFVTQRQLKPIEKGTE